MNITYSTSSQGILKDTDMDRFQRSSLDSAQLFDNMKRRSSSRSIKRRKFDDELVESSLNTGGATGLSGKIPRTRTPSMSIIPISTSTDYLSASGSSSHISVPSPAAVPEKSRRSTSKGSGRRNRKVKTSHAAAKDLGRWKPTDDLALIIGVEQTNDLRMVHRGIKFSCRFTIQEVQQRWYALLYDPAISRLAVASMRNLHPEQIASVRSKALYSKQEEELLATIKANSSPTVETFYDMLQSNPQVFFSARTPKALMNHWHLMKHYCLLPEQNVLPLPQGDSTILSFSDAEENINDAELVDPSDIALEQELGLADRRAKKEIRTLENEVGRWQVLVDSVTGISPVDFDNQTLAVLKGRLVRYLMRSREITIGRSTKDHSVDVDLTLEGPAWKVSRRQGTIRLRNNGDFYLASEGKRAIFVDGRPILAGNKYRLNNNSVVEIAGLRFIFLVNQELVGVIKQEAIKLNLQTNN